MLGDLLKVADHLCPQIANDSFLPSLHVLRNCSCYDLKAQRGIRTNETLAQWPFYYAVVFLQISSPFEAGCCTMQPSNVAERFSFRLHLNLHHSMSSRDGDALRANTYLIGSFFRGHLNGA